MSKKNLLFVSIAFPPKRDSEGLQVAKYFKYFAKSEKYNIDVVTSSNPTLFMPVDESLKKYTSGVRQLIEISFFESKILNFIIRKLFPEQLTMPDSKHRFYNNWKKVVSTLSSPPDIIYSRSFPLSSTVMAYHLQKHYSVPWVLHLSDPWTLPNSLRFPNLTTGSIKWNKDMEIKCIDAASLVTFTSQGILELECYS